MRVKDWQYLAPILAKEGYCVFSLTYGRNPLAPPPLTQVVGLVEMERSATEFGAFVERVLAATGAKQVDVVGHSEGGLMPNQYVRFSGGATTVRRYVGLTPLWDGTRLLALDQLDGSGGGSAWRPATAHCWRGSAARAGSSSAGRTSCAGWPRTAAPHRRG